jgi:hypothetical protein
VGIFRQLRETPSVKAANLLKKAVASAEARPQAVRRIRIRTRHAQFTRTVGRLTVERAPEPAEVSALFQKAGYDPGDPLSARAYQEWRGRLGGNATDQVDSTAGAYRIRTEPQAGEVAAASLKLRASDLEPVEGRLEFRDSEFLDMSEIPEPSTRGESAPVASNGVEAPLRPAEPSQPAAAAPGPSASISDELQVLAALHRIGADLGDPVEVRLSEGKVEVGGTGVAPARQQQILEALADLPNVAVRFSEPAPLTGEPSGLPPQTAAGPAPLVGVRARIEQQLGGRAEFERFSSQVLDDNEAAMARAYALRGLGRRFPAGSEASLPPADRVLLRRMAREHVNELARHADALDRALAGPLAALGGTAAAVRHPEPRDWEEASGQLFDSARRVEVLLSVLLGAAPDREPEANLPSDLLTALRALHDDLSACERLLPVDAGG